MSLSPAIQTEKPLMSEKRVALIAAMLAALGAMCMSFLTPVMPAMTEAYQVTDATIKLTMSLYLAGFALSMLVCGPLSDGLGRKTAVNIFMSIFVLASLVALLAPSVDVLIAARFFQGVGAAVGTTVSRAMVRDLYTGDHAAKIMNLIGLILGIGPALAPTVGGFMMLAFGWQSVFVLMFLLGIAIMLVVHFFMAETITRDVSRIKPKALIQTYSMLLRHPQFLSASICLGGAIGFFYALSIILPFVLMRGLGMSPAEFGIGMLLQSASFFVGGLCVRQALKRFGANKIVPLGMAFIMLGCMSLALNLRIFEPNYWLIMIPLAFYAFGAAFVTPAMNVAILAPFPHNAGAASALNGFIQFGVGIVIGMSAVLFSSSFTALATLMPLMGLMSLLCYCWWRQLA